MRNRIACSAQELFQLDPEMVQSVVGGQVFQIGNEYFSNSRVTILESDATQVVAEVNGTYGVYTQTIKLKGGTLSTKCSCPSTEQPFCRHCVAVLLHQFHLIFTQEFHDCYWVRNEILVSRRFLTHDSSLHLVLLSFMKFTL